MLLSSCISAHISRAAMLKLSNGSEVNLMLMSCLFIINNEQLTKLLTSSIFNNVELCSVIFSFTQVLYQSFPALATVCTFSVKSQKSVCTT